MKLVNITLLCILLLGCNTQPGKVIFPFDEAEFKKPKKVKVTPTIHRIPDSLPYAKYTTDKGQLIKRDPSIPLKIATMKKVGNPKLTKNLLKKREIPTNLQTHLAGTPKKVKAKVKIAPALGRVVMAGTPISLPYTAPTIRDQDNYGFRNISLDQNLPGTFGGALIEDSHGRIWIGTSNGLVVLEGEEMKIYTKEEGLSSNHVRSLLESSSGAIWIGTYGGGVDVFESGHFTHYGTEEGLSNNKVWSLLESSSGAIWIGTDGGGVDVFESGHFTHYGTEEGLSNNHVWSLLESSAGAIWIGTYGGGVDIFESGHFTNYSIKEGLSSNHVKSLLQSSTGAIWIGTLGGGVDVFESGSILNYSIKEGLANNTILSLLESSTGAIWIGTYGGGVDVFESGHITHYSMVEGLSSDAVSSLLESSTGAIWIGTIGGGVNFVDPGRHIHYDNQNGLNFNGVFSLLESTEGNIWFGNERGVHVFNGENFINYDVSEGLSDNTVTSLLESSTGAIWIGTFDGGVNVYESGSFTHYGIEEGLNSNRVYSLLESSTGAIWIGTNGGLNVIEAGHFLHYSTNEGLSNNRITSLFESSTGAIWIGTDGGGVDVFESGILTHYGIAEGLSSNHVRSLLESATGAIWIGTDDGGINIIDSDSISHYGISEGLADNTVPQLSMDSLGNIWAGTGKGLTRFVAKEDGYELTSWNKSHGLKYMDFNGSGNSLFTKTDKISKKGTMWSGVGQVLSAFEPPLVDTLKPALFLTGMDIGHKQIEWRRISDVKEKMMTMKGINSDTLFFPDWHSVLPISNNASDTSWLTRAGIHWSDIEELTPYPLPKDLKLPYDQNHLTFHYSGMKHSEQFDIVYRYILEGMDKEWSPFTQERKVDYRNLPPGTYTFRVRARGRNFLWSDEKSISFLVDPPWWLTLWAKTLWVGLVLGIFLTIYKLRTTSLKKQRKKLEIMVEVKTKEVVHQKDQILIQAELLEEQNKELQLQAQELHVQAKKLEAQTEELGAQNEEITALNDQLESRVNERTKSLAESNQRLIEYAYNNAHMIRGPLARLLGLTYILKITKTDNLTEIKDLMSKIEESSAELDVVIRELGKNLTKETGINPFKDPTEE